MRFAFVQAHATEHHVTTLCRVLAVSKAGYYAWVARGPSQHARDDAVLATAIRAVQAGTAASGARTAVRACTESFGPWAGGTARSVSPA